MSKRMYLLYLTMVAATAQAQENTDPKNQIATTAGESALSQEKPLTELEQYKKSLLDAGNKMVVTERPYEFINAIREAIGSAPHRSIEAVGFSGADYANKALFAKQFETAMTAEYEKFQIETNGEGKLVVALGASVDGFGKAYEVLAKMKTGGMSNLIIVGMASSQVVGYHLEGAAKGWGDVISPRQDITMLMDTRDAKGEKTWEMLDGTKSLSETISFVTRAADHGKLDLSKGSVLYVFEGGDQALKETIGTVFAATMTTEEIKVKLLIGHEAGKVKKDKGWRGASDAALVLAELLDVIPKNVKIFVETPNRAYSLADFAKSKDFSDLAEKAKNAQARGIELSNELGANPDLEQSEKDKKGAEMLRTQALGKLKQIAAKALEEVRIPIQRQNESTRNALNSSTSRIHDTVGLAERWEIIVTEREAIVRNFETIEARLKSNVGDSVDSSRLKSLKSGVTREALARSKEAGKMTTLPVGEVKARAENESAREKTRRGKKSRK